MKAETYHAPGKTRAEAAVGIRHLLTDPDGLSTEEVRYWRRKLAQYEGDAETDLRESLETLVESHGWQRVSHALQSIRDEEQN